MKGGALAVAALIAATAGRAQAPFDLDQSFGTAITERYVSSVLVLPDSRLLISGQFKFPGDASYRSIARLDSEGALDQTFTATNGGGGKLTPWSAGFYVVSGPGVRRLNDNGSIDTQFSMINAPYFGAIQAGDYFVYPDGRILFSGAHELSDSIRGYEGIYNLIWFSNTGYLDTTQHHRYCNGSIDRIFPLPDGRFLLSGVFSTYEGQPVGSIIRVEADGALDTTFQTEVEWGFARDLILLPDARVVATGMFRFAATDDTLHVIRLLPDGALDVSYAAPIVSSVQGGKFVPVTDIHQLDENSYIICGNFDHLGTDARGGIAMLDSTGQLRQDYFNGPGCGPYLDLQFIRQGPVAIQPALDGSYYIYGGYYGYDDGTTNDPYQRFVSRLYGLNVGVQEVSETAAQLQVNPNPSAGHFALALTLPETLTLSGDLVLQVFDVQGRLVERRNLGRQLRQTVALDLSAQPSGLYSAHLSDGNRILSGVRLVVSPP